MPRRKALASNRITERAYFLNATPNSSVYERPMVAIVNHVEAAFLRGRWYALHLRFVPNGIAHGEILRHLVKSLHGSMYCRYVWKVEQSARAKQEDGSKDGIHFHVALFLDSTKINVVSEVRRELARMQAEGWFKSYKRCPPRISLAKKNAKNWAELVKDFQSLNKDMPEYLYERCHPSGLELTHMDSVRYAIYWLSYLAKESTTLANGRSFGASALPKNWRDSPSRILA